MLANETAICRVCGEEKSIELFRQIGVSKRTGNPRRLRQCKQCENRASYNRAKKHHTQTPDAIKTCSSCNEDKPLSAFYVGNYQCKKCFNQACQKRLKANPEKHQKKLEQIRQWRHENDYLQKYKQKVKEDPELRERINHASSQSAIKRKKGLIGYHTFSEWQALKAKYGHQCACCGKKEPDIQLTRDHIVPLSRGGVNTIDNIQPLCRSCNSRKNAKEVWFVTDATRHLAEFVGLPLFFTFEYSKQQA